jgi:hypothetical protein
LPDFGESGAPMRCLPATSPLLMEGGYSVPGIEGFACSPSGALATDCTHSCRSGECVGTSAVSGTECQPKGGASVCAGSCDGDGNCVRVTPGIANEYQLIGVSCAFDACNPLHVGLESGMFPVPAGRLCFFSGCGTCGTCNDDGICVGEVCDADWPDAGAEGGEPDFDATTSSVGLTCVGWSDASSKALAEAGAQADSSVGASGEADTSESAGPKASGCSMVNGGSSSSVEGLAACLFGMAVVSRRRRHTVGGSALGR